MSGISFQTAAAPTDDNVFPLGGDDGQDSTPPTYDTPDETCGHRNNTGDACLKDPGHSGRHRYRPLASGSGTATRGRGNSNAQLASQAADAISSLAALLGTGAYVMGFTNTGRAMSVKEREDAFREQNYNALLTDPGLCRMILRAGTTSGRLALFLSVGMYGFSLMPYVQADIEARRTQEAA